MDKSSEPAMQEIIKAVRQSGYSMHDILNSMGYYGFKLWLQEDVEAQFKTAVEDGRYPDCQDKTARELGATIQECDRELSVATDYDWYVIDEVIDGKMRQRQQELERPGR